jgi:hypothetical protein
VTHPTRWTNQFFRNLLKYDWEVHEGPGGHNQWRPKHKATAPAAVQAEPLPHIMSELTLGHNCLAVLILAVSVIYPALALAGARANLLGCPARCMFELMQRPAQSPSS